MTDGYKSFLSKVLKAFLIADKRSDSSLKPNGPPEFIEMILFNSIASFFDIILLILQTTIFLLLKDFLR